MTDRNIELSRRKILGAAGAIGIAGAGAGLGTSALFSDEESFTNNSIEAGTLDLVIDYVTTVTQDGVSTGSMTNDGTIQGGVSGKYQIADAKPGDSGFLAFCPKIVDNPGWLFVGSAEGVTDYENGQTEPEGDVDGTGGGSLGSPNDGAGAGELSEAIQVDVEYCEVADGVTDPSGPDDYNTIREFNNPDDYTLADLFKELESGFLLDGAPDTSGGDPPGTQEYPSSPDQSTQKGPCLCISWDIPIDVGNEIQSDGVEFDITFAARQWRNNPNPENPIATTTVWPGNSIQSAIDSASGGDVISVFGGDFGDGSDYGEQVTISNELTLARASAERPTIEGKVNIGDQSDTTLSGEVVIDGVEMATTDSGVTDGVVSVGDRQQKIENATIKNSVIDIDLSGSSVGVGIYSEEVDNLAMENNAFTESGSGTSVAYNAAESPVNTIEMSENTLTDVDRLYNEGAGFIKGRGISSTTVRIVDNDVNGAGTAIGIGDSDDALDTVDYVISGNQIDASTVGILQNGGDPASFTIENNEFSSSSIYVDDSDNPILNLGDILNNQNNTFTPSAEVVGEQIVPE